MKRNQHLAAKTSLFVCSILFSLFISSSESFPDIIFFNGSVLTVNNDFDVVSALAIKDERVLHVGSDEEVFRFRGKTTQLVNLHGKTLMPGLIDSHAHPVDASQSEADHTIPNMATVQDVLDYVRERALSVKPGTWIWVTNEMFTRLKEMRFPTRLELDRVAPNHPVVIISLPVSPLAALNSNALEYINIEQIETEYPDYIKRDQLTGQPNGVIHKPMLFLPSRNPSRVLEFDQKERLLKSLLSTYNEVGLTTVSERNASDADIDLYLSLNRADSLTTRVRLLHDLDTRASRQLSDIVADIEQIGKHPLRASDPMLQLIGVKTKLDGGILTGTAYMRDSWGGSKFYPIPENSKGHLFIPNPRLASIVGATVREGLQFAGHAVGDGAVSELLHAIELVNAPELVEQTRPVIVHGNFIGDDLIDKAKRLHAVVDVQPMWLYLDGRMLLEQFGNARMSAFQPLKTMFDQGLVIGGGSDHWWKTTATHSTNPFSPFMGMWTSVTRLPRSSDSPIHAEEKLSREQAIRLYTSNNAFLLHMEDQVGSFEPGKFADLIILDRNPLTCSENELRNTKVLQTYLGGKLVYSAKK